METILNHQKLLTPQEVARLLRVKVETLANWRCNDRYPGLPYIKIGSRIRYRWADIEAFLEKHLCSSESGHGV